jgi:DNA-directed RNA polymerase specialized sigma24 family protein
MSELPRTDDPPLDAERVEEAFAAFGDRVRELEAVAAELRAELRALRADRAAPPLQDDEEWPADVLDRASIPSHDWVATVPPPLSRGSAAPRLLAEAAFLVGVAVLAGLADLSAAWIALVMVVAWALVALSEWAAASRRARWRLDAVAPSHAATTEPALDTTGPWDMPVVQQTAIETADGSESRTVVAKLPPEPEAPPQNEVEQTLAPLSDREKEVLRLRYGLGADREYTLEEIGRRLSVTRERVRQIESRALQKLRAAKQREASSASRRRPA